MKKKTFGYLGEKKAREYLIKKNYTILDSNFRCSIGEIDIVASDDEYIIFIEVKTRSSSYCGYPYEAVDVRKRSRYVRLATYYIVNNKLQGNNFRFDIIELIYNNSKWYLNHIINAFDATNSGLFI